jgi:hypothetical protein
MDSVGKRFTIGYSFLMLAAALILSLPISAYSR